MKQHVNTGLASLKSSIFFVCFSSKKATLESQRCFFFIQIKCVLLCVLTSTGWLKKGMRVRIVEVMDTSSTFSNLLQQ